METLSGWLFLNLERTRLVFVADELQVEETFDWNILLHGDCLERFIHRFNATPTSEGPLQGYRVDTNVLLVKQWLHDCADNHEAHSQRTRSFKLPKGAQRYNDETESEGSLA